MTLSPNSVGPGEGGTGVPTAPRSAPPILTSADQAVEIARNFAPRIASRQAEVEAARMVDLETISALAAAGLFGLMGAREFGGSEIGVEALVRVTMEIAEACGSTGWIFGVLAGHSWMLNLFPVKIQQELAGRPGSLTATLFRLAADVERVEGGYVIKNGSGRFCSGIDFAEQVIVGSSVARAAGAGSPEPRFFVVQRSDVEIVDDWFTNGMRGTGSRSIRISESFVPEHRSVAVADMLAGTTPGASFHRKPLYRLPFGTVTPFSIVGAPLGMARGALKCFAAANEPYLDPKAALKGSQQTLLMKFARASTVIDAAIALVLADTVTIDRLSDPQSFDEHARKKLPRNWSWAIQACRDAVNELYALSGASAIYDNSTIQRYWRDINAAAQHFGFSEDRALLDYAHVRFGLPAEPYIIPVRK